jgi:3-methylfumaryl-CoA hydratase
LIDLNEWVGRSQTVTDCVTQSGVDRYCATLDLAIDGDAKSDHIKPSHAPLGHHWCLGLPNDLTAQLGEDGHPKKGGFLPPVELPRRMWAASKVSFLHAIPIGADIERHSRIALVTEKNGKSGALVFVEVDHETKVDSQVAISERQTIVYREASTVSAALPEDASENTIDKPNDWAVVEHLVPSPQLLFRYSALTFNSHRIHYDLPYAQTQELYPGLIVHAPLMASLALQLAAKQGDVSEFSFRAVSPAYCDQPLFVVANLDQIGGEVATLGGDGRTCLSAQIKFR